MSILFSSPQGITVSQAADGTVSWLGFYDGIVIKSAIPNGRRDRCVLLLDPDASQLPVFENLLCIDLNGVRVWTATLPSSPDVFVDITPNPEGISARTWSGFDVLIDEKTGAELRRRFAK